MPGVDKRLSAPSRQRTLPKCGFSWIDRRLVRDGFLDGLTAPEALLYFFDLLAYAIRPGAAVPAGQTVGRTADEKLRVRDERSPVDATKQVWRVDLPARRSPRAR